MTSGIQRESFNQFLEATPFSLSESPHKETLPASDPDCFVTGKLVLTAAPTASYINRISVTLVWPRLLKEELLSVGQHRKSNNIRSSLCSLKYNLKDTNSVNRNKADSLPEFAELFMQNRLSEFVECRLTIQNPSSKPVFVQLLLLDALLAGTDNEGTIPTDFELMWRKHFSDASNLPEGALAFSQSVSRYGRFSLNLSSSTSDTTSVNSLQGLILKAGLSNASFPDCCPVLVLPPKGGQAVFSLQYTPPASNFSSDASGFDLAQPVDTNVLLIRNNLTSVESVLIKAVTPRASLSVQLGLWPTDSASTFSPQINEPSAALVSFNPTVTPFCELNCSISTHLRRYNLQTSLDSMNCLSSGQHMCFAPAAIKVADPLSFEFQESRLLPFCVDGVGRARASISGFFDNLASFFSSKGSTTNSPVNSPLFDFGSWVLDDTEQPLYASDLISGLVLSRKISIFNDGNLPILVLRFGLTRSTQAGNFSNPTKPTGAWVDIAGEFQSCLSYLNGFSVSLCDTKEGSARQFVLQPGERKWLEVFFSPDFLHTDVRTDICMFASSNLQHNSYLSRHHDGSKIDLDRTSLDCNSSVACSVFRLEPIPLVARTSLALVNVCHESLVRPSVEESLWKLLFLVLSSNLIGVFLMSFFDAQRILSSHQRTCSQHGPHVLEIADSKSSGVLNLNRNLSCLGSRKNIPDEIYDDSPPDSCDDNSSCNLLEFTSPHVRGFQMTGGSFPTSLSPSGRRKARQKDFGLSASTSSLFQMRWSFVWPSWLFSFFSSSQKDIHKSVSPVASVTKNSDADRPSENKAKLYRESEPVVSGITKRTREEFSENVAAPKSSPISEEVQISSKKVFGQKNHAKLPPITSEKPILEEISIVTEKSSISPALLSRSSKRASRLGLSRSLNELPSSVMHMSFVEPCHEILQQADVAQTSVDTDNTVPDVVADCIQSSVSSSGKSMNNNSTLPPPPGGPKCRPKRVSTVVETASAHAPLPFMESINVDSASLRLIKSKRGTKTSQPVRTTSPLGTVQKPQKQHLDSTNEISSKNLPSGHIPHEVMSSSPRQQLQIRNSAPVSTAARRRLPAKNSWASYSQSQTTHRSHIPGSFNSDPQPPFLHPFMHVPPRLYYRFGQAPWLGRPIIKSSEHIGESFPEFELPVSSDFYGDYPLQGYSSQTNNGGSFIHADDDLIRGNYYVSHFGSYHTPLHNYYGDYKSPFRPRMLHYEGYAAEPRHSPPCTRFVSPNHYYTKHPSFSLQSAHKQSNRDGLYGCVKPFRDPDESAATENCLPFSHSGGDRHLDVIQPNWAKGHRRRRSSTGQLPQEPFAFPQETIWSSQHSSDWFGVSSDCEKLLYGSAATSTSTDYYQPFFYGGELQNFGLIESESLKSSNRQINELQYFMLSRRQRMLIHEASHLNRPPLVAHSDVESELFDADELRSNNFDTISKLSFETGNKLCSAGDTFGDLGFLNGISGLEDCAARPSLNIWSSSSDVLEPGDASTTNTAWPPAFIPWSRTWSHASPEPDSMSATAEDTFVSNSNDRCSLSNHFYKVINESMSNTESVKPAERVICRPLHSNEVLPSQLTGASDDTNTFSSDISKSESDQNLDIRGAEDVKFL